MLKFRIPYALFVCLTAVAIAGCGSIYIPGSPVSTSIFAVAVTCTPSAVTGNATVQCNATVQGTGSYSQEVKWAASAGTIHPNGTLTVPSSAGNVTVTARSVQNTSAVGQAMVTVQDQAPAGPTISSVSVTCSPSVVAPGGTAQCQAAVQGTGNYNSALTWTASAGSISSDGVLTAPSDPGNVTVTARSVEDSAKAGGATLEVKANPPTISSVAVTCSPTAVAAGATAQCTANVQGTGNYSSAVNWSASAGTVNSAGVFTAPPSTGTVTVTATSAQDASKTASATIAVNAPASPTSTITGVGVTCSPTTVAAGGTAQCSANVQGTGSYNSAVTWSVSGGSITANGLVLAPASAGTLTVTATSVQDPTRTGTATVAVNAPAAPTSTITSVAVTCSPTTVAPGGTAQCSANVQGTGSYSSAVTWAASGGSITASGLVTAPASAGNLMVTATSAQDPTRTGAATLAVNAPASTITSVAVTCSQTTVATGGTAQCSASVQGTGSYNSAVTWAVSRGSVTTNGLVTAPASAGTMAVTATSAQDASKTASANLAVNAPASTITSVAVTCSPTTVAPGGTAQCSANVQGTGSYNSAVTWTASAGTISAGGALTAPQSGSVTVTATSVQDTTITAKATVTVQSAQPQSRHVVLVMEENQSYSTVAGNGNWPALNSLINNGALATNYYANTHPSIGNYFMLTTGQILTNDDSSTQVWNVDNLARRMLASGVSFRIYAEGITQGYVGGNTGAYVVRHNPFALLSDLANNPQAANAHIFPFSQFAQDLASGNLPEFSYIVPNVDDDAHDGTPAQADAWLQSQVVGLLSNDAAFQPGGDGVLAVAFDEAVDTDTTNGGGQVVAAFWGPIVKSGYREQSGTLYQHPSLLREIMDLLNLPNPPGAAAGAPSMREFFLP